MDELVKALTNALVLVITTITPVLIGYLIRKFKIEGDIAAGKKLESTTVDLAMGIEEWAAMMNKTGSPVSSADKASRFIQELNVDYPAIDSDKAMQLSHVAAAKIGVGSSGVSCGAPPIASAVTMEKLSKPKFDPSIMR